MLIIVQYWENTIKNIFLKHKVEVIMKKYVFKYKAIFFLSVFIRCLESAADVSIAFLLKYILDLGTNKDLLSFTKNLKYIILYLICYFFIIYLRKVTQAMFVKKNIQNLKNEIYISIIDKNIPDFISKNSAFYISILTNDINILEQDYFVNLLDLIGDLAGLAIGTIAIFKVNIQIAATVFIVGAITLVIPILFSKTVSNLRKKHSDSLSNLTTNIKDTFSGFEIIKGFNIENNIKEEFGNYNSKTEDSKFKFAKFSAGVETLSVSASTAMFFVAILLGTYLLIQNRISFGLLLAAIQLMNNIVPPIAMLSQRINKLKSTKLLVDNIESICTRKELTLNGISKDDFNDKIVINNLNFSYTGDKKVLKDLNLTIEKGKKYAIVGKSGCGKSTFLRILLRYYDDFSGNILMDGTDIRNININDIYKIMSIIHQNVFMFDSTIKDNITLYKNYSDDDINTTIKLCGLYDFINSKPRKMFADVGENGVLLSGGEKQRIAIARAIIKKTPILILDEATSSLDSETAYSIENSLLNIDELTCIVVTHNLSENILKQYDSIITLKDGQIVEQGKFYNLLEQKGYFYSLYNVYK